MNLRIVAPLLLTSAFTVAPLAAQQPQPDPQAQAPVQQQAPEPGKHGHHHHGPEHEVRMLTRKLNLTPDQAAQLEPILATEHEQMRALRTNGTTDPATLAEQRKSIAHNTHEQVAAVLTPEQREQWKVLRAEHHHHGMPPTPDAAPAPTA